MDTHTSKKVFFDLLGLTCLLSALKATGVVNIPWLLAIAPFALWLIFLLFGFVFMVFTDMLTRIVSRE